MISLLYVDIIWLQMIFLQSSLYRKFNKNLKNYLLTTSGHKMVTFKHSGDKARLYFLFILPPTA